MRYIVTAALLLFSVSALAVDPRFDCPSNPNMTCAEIAAEQAEDTKPTNIAKDAAALGLIDHHFDLSKHAPAQWSIGAGRFGGNEALGAAIGGRFREGTPFLSIELGITDSHAGAALTASGQF